MNTPIAKETTPLLTKVKKELKHKTLLEFLRSFPQPLRLVNSSDPNDKWEIDLADKPPSLCKCYPKGSNIQNREYWVHSSIKISSQDELVVRGILSNQDNLRVRIFICAPPTIDVQIFRAPAHVKYRAPVKHKIVYF